MCAALASGGLNETDSTECSTSSNLGRRVKAGSVGARLVRERYGRHVMARRGPVGIGLARQARRGEVRFGELRSGMAGVVSWGQEWNGEFRYGRRGEVRSGTVGQAGVWQANLKGDIA